MRKHFLDLNHLEVDTFSAMPGDAMFQKTQEPGDTTDPDTTEPPDWLTRVNCVTGNYWIDCA